MRQGAREAALTVCMALALSGCDKCPPKQPTETTTPAPVFGQLHLANPSGGWASHTFTPPTALVLPARGRGVRVVFTVPGIRTFVVSLREPNGTLTALPQNPSGGVQAPTAGFFEIVDTNTANPTTVYTMYVRAPASLTSPAAYDIEVVTQSLSASVPNSAPMVVRLGPRPIFTVTVSVSGNGHVTSSPGGIQCGTAPSGQPLNDCTYEFGPGTVNLAAQTNDVMANTRFLGWTGNCPGGGQTCTLTLTGTSALTAVATFVPKSSPAPVFGCPAAPQLTGLRWIDMPQCDTIAHTTSVALCDTGGVYFCCQPASAANPHPASVQGRCGIGQKEDPPNCMHRAPLGMLRQPGGCYEVAP